MLVFVEAAVVVFLAVFVAVFGAVFAAVFAAVFVAALALFAGSLPAAGVGFNAMLVAVAAAT